MQKIYRKLRQEQIERGVIFSSTLTEHRQEREGGIVHEVMATDEDQDDTIARLLDDKFFNASRWKYNIVRRGQ